MLACMNKYAQSSTHGQDCWVKWDLTFKPDKTLDYGIKPDIEDCKNSIWSDGMEDHYSEAEYTNAIEKMCKEDLA